MLSYIPRPTGIRPSSFFNDFWVRFASERFWALTTPAGESIPKRMRPNERKNALPLYFFISSIVKR